MVMNEMKFILRSTNSIISGKVEPEEHPPAALLWKGLLRPALNSAWAKSSAIKSPACRFEFTDH